MMICFFMIRFLNVYVESPASFEDGAGDMKEIALRNSGARLGVTQREDQHAAVLAENEITRLALRRVDNDRRMHGRVMNLGLKAAGAQRRAACCDEQHQEIGHNGKGVSTPRVEAK
jgi:hypothetical protein